MISFHESILQCSFYAIRKMRILGDKVEDVHSSERRGVFSTMTIKNLKESSDYEMYEQSFFDSNSLLEKLTHIHD